MQEAVGQQGQTDTAPCVAALILKESLYVHFSIYLFKLIAETWKVNSSRHCRLLSMMLNILSLMKCQWLVEECLAKVSIGFAMHFYTEHKKY